VHGGRARAGHDSAQHVERHHAHANESTVARVIDGALGEANSFVEIAELPRAVRETVVLAKRSEGDRRVRNRCVAGTRRGEVRLDALGRTRVTSGADRCKAGAVRRVVGGRERGGAHELGQRALVLLDGDVITAADRELGAQQGDLDRRERAGLRCVELGAREPGFARGVIESALMHRRDADVDPARER